MAALLLRSGAQRTLSTPPLRCSSRLALDLLSPFHSSLAFMGPVRTSRALPSACLAPFIQVQLLWGRGWRGVFWGLGLFGGGLLGFLSVGIDGI